MQPTIQLIVGLGNPGSQYEATRHNAGAWLINQICESYNVVLRMETKFKGLLGEFTLENQPCRLLIPTTFMNLSGEAVSAISNFHKIPASNILVAHDDLDLPAGVVRLKFGGGHGGHNGLRSILAHLHTNEFHRLRIGIGHPGNSNDVLNYVLHRPSLAEKQLIDDGISTAIAILPSILKSDMQKAMNMLHTQLK